MKRYIATLLLLSLWLSCVNSKRDVAAHHPRIYTSTYDKKTISKRIEKSSWAKESFEALRERIEPYVARHRSDSEWIVSRLAMYWSEGERYTQCYLLKQNWDRGEGNAPVPTVRMPGMRTWNQYVNVPLEERTPYNTTGDMWGRDRTNPEAEPVLVPYKESGHLIRGNNVEILTLAENAAFIYWITNDERYARFAADIYYTWLVGTYYMKPILDPTRSTGSGGGWEPGGICGYYDYEQIHDDLAMHAAPIYDFLYDYLASHPDPHLQSLGKSTEELTEEVFRRFIDIGMIRGGRSGNWNINGWNVVMRPIIALRGNDAYADGRGREYYLDLFLNTTTDYHESLNDILVRYDSVTGLWDEAPGYSFSTISMLLDFAVMLNNLGVDIIREHPVMQKAALAVFPWIDEKGNMVVFGDSRGGMANFETFERLLTYYTSVGDKASAAIVGSAISGAIEMGSYSRNRADWVGICTLVDEVPAVGGRENIRTAYSAHHRHITMKDFSGQYKLMATLYGGHKGYHLSPNGLALQLYGYGYALAPDAAAYESYWGADHAYHQSALGSNTVLPGYTEGEITVNRIVPSIADGEFYNAAGDSNIFTYADVSAGEKRRVAGVVRADDKSGYYIDIFFSEQSENDYIFHNVGKNLAILDANGKALEMKSVSDLGIKYSAAYSYFTNQRKTAFVDDFIARWDVGEGVTVDFFQAGAADRQLYAVDAPYSTLNDKLTPQGVSSAPLHTPTLIIRQRGNAPFVGVYEAYKGNRMIESVGGKTDGGSIILTVKLHNGKIDTLTYSTDTGLNIKRTKR